MEYGQLRKYFFHFFSVLVRRKILNKTFKFREKLKYKKFSQFSVVNSSRKLNRFNNNNNLNPGLIIVLVRREKIYRLNRRNLMRSINHNFRSIVGTRKEIDLVNKRYLPHCAAKTRFPDENKKEWTKEKMSNLINNHGQFSTDFNIIYENASDIQIYLIGTLMTNPIGNSHILSENLNYSLESKRQSLEFFEKPILVKNDIHVIKKSILYFQNKDIRNKIEQTDEYKNSFNQVVEQLKRKNVKFRIAENEKDLQLTGYNVLLENNKKSSNEYMDVISKPKDEVD